MEESEWDKINERVKPKYFDKEGKPIDLMTWGRLFEDENYKVIKQQQIGDYLISTVWMGVDYNFNRFFDKDSPLHIFETMVFSKKDKDADLDQERYSTLEEAKAGHEELVKKYKNKRRK